MRDFALIDAEIAELESKLEALHVERAKAATAKREAIIKAFDEGATRLQICELFGVTYCTLNNLLNRMGRNDRQRHSIGLQPAQQALYQRLIRQKIGPRAARKIAEVIP